MQTSRFLEITAELEEGARIKELAQCLSPLFIGPNIAIDSIRNVFQSLIFQSREHLYYLLRDDEFKKVATDLGLVELFDPQLISKLINVLQAQVNRDDLFKHNQYFQSLYRFYTGLTTLITVFQGLKENIDEPRKTGLLETESFVEFDVWDLGRVGFSFDRLAEIFPDIQALLVELGQIYECENRDISILFLDSGSDLLIGVKADGKIVEAARKLFIAVWEKIRFRKQDDFSRDLAAIDESLEVLQKISDRETSAAIDPETAARMKYIVTEKTFSLISKGVTLHEIKRVELIDNRLAMRSQVEGKYLTDKAPESP